MTTKHLKNEFQKYEIAYIYIYLSVYTIKCKCSEIFKKILKQLVLKHDVHINQNIIVLKMHFRFLKLILAISQSIHLLFYFIQQYQSSKSNYDEH